MTIQLCYFDCSGIENRLQACGFHTWAETQPLSGIQPAMSPPGLVLPLLYPPLHIVFPVYCSVQIVPAASPPRPKGPSCTICNPSSSNSNSVTFLCGLFWAFGFCAKSSPLVATDLLDDLWSFVRFLNLSNYRFTVYRTVLIRDFWLCPNLFCLLSNIFWPVWVSFLSMSLIRSDTDPDSR